MNDPYKIYEKQFKSLVEYITKKLDEQLLEELRNYRNYKYPKVEAVIDVGVS